MYIFIGLALLLVVLLFVFAKKFAPNSAMMVTLQGKKLQTFVLLLSLLGVASVGYGVYYQATYQLPSVDIKVEGEKHTVFGDIGKLGYFSDQLIKKDRESNVFLVTWKELDVSKVKISIRYPSGKEEILKTDTELNDNKVIDKLKKEHDIVGIYKLGSYTFTEKGDVVLQVKEEKEIVAETKIKVK